MSAKPSQPAEVRAIAQRLLGKPKRPAADSQTKAFAESITAPSHPWLRRSSAKISVEEQRKKQRELMAEHHGKALTAYAEQLKRRTPLFASFNNRFR